MDVKSTGLARMLESPVGKQMIDEALRELSYRNNAAGASLHIIVRMLDRCIEDIDPTADLPYLFKCLRSYFLKEKGSWFNRRSMAEKRRLGGLMFDLVSEMAMCMLAAGVDARDQPYAALHREWLKKFAAAYNQWCKA